MTEVLCRCLHTQSKHMSGWGKCLYNIVGVPCNCQEFDGIRGRTDPEMKFKEENKAEW